MTPSVLPLYDMHISIFRCIARAQSDVQKSAHYSSKAFLNDSIFVSLGTALGMLK